MPDNAPYEIEAAPDPPGILPEGYTVDQLDTAKPELRDFTIVVCFEDERRERLLMARHEERGWELPGGRVEPHEHPLESGVREFGEETGHRLKGAQLLLRLETDHGVCWVLTGFFGDPVEGYERPPDEVIEEVRFVERVSDVEPLAFPDDPYEEIGAALVRPLR